jgi:hypothetical protein
MTVDEEKPRESSRVRRPKEPHGKNEIWNMSFDGTVSKEGGWGRRMDKPPKVGTKLVLIYKLAFECTNNMVSMRH